MTIGSVFFESKKVILVTIIPERMYCRVLLISICWLACIFCVAQNPDEKKFIHYTTKDGLSNNDISGIIQDSTGYIWISTAHGLNRFDGSSFKQFLHTSGKNSIPDNSIFTMQRLPHDQLAIATDDGAQIISAKTLDRKNLDIPTTDELRYWANACRYVYEDNEGNYGVSTKTGFYIFSSTGQLKKRLDRYTAKDVGTTWMMFGSRLYKMPDGNIVQENKSGFTLFDRKSNQFAEAKKYFPNLESLFSELKKTRDRFLFVSRYYLLVLNETTNTLDLVDVRNGNTHSLPACFNLHNELGWQSNVSHLDNNSWAINSINKGFYLIRVDTITNTISCDGKKYFSDHLCSVIFSDKQNRLWIGTNEGLFMEEVHPPAISSFSVSPKNRGDNFSITSLFVSGDKIFVGTNKKEVIVLDKQTKNIIRRILLDTLANRENLILSIQQFDHDTIWIAAPSGLSWLNTRNFSCGNLIGPACFEKLEPQFLFRDQKNNVWIGANAIGYDVCYNYASRKFQRLADARNLFLKINIPNSYAEDNKGNIWIGGDAIGKWDPQSNKFDTVIEHLATQKNRKKGFLVMNDSKGDIWVMINDDGFARITGSSPVHVRPENLLLNSRTNVYSTLIQDKIFIPTGSGVGYFDTHDLQGIVFNYADGVPDQALTTQHFSYDSTDRSVWFACKDIICSIPLAQNKYPGPAALNIADIFLSNDSIINYPNKNLTLSHDQNDLNISLSAINFNDPYNMRFAYRFKNKSDTNWIDMGSQQNILLTNISPGKYKMETKVYAFDNKWPAQIKEIEITIEPPFWRRAWFLAIVSLVVAGSVYYLYKKRVRGLKQKADLDKQLAQSEMKALHSQMNPHFIFNSLNSISQMVMNDEKLNATRYLGNYAQLIRMNLEHSQQTFISLKENIEYLQLYLELEHTRTNNFVHSLEVDEDLDPNDIMLPPMLIQPFIENAIWYGPTDTNSSMNLRIRFLKKKDELLCIIEDNGIGIETSMENKNRKMSSHRSMGISNVRQRIKILNEKYGLNYSLVIIDKSRENGSGKTGTIVTLAMPLNFSYS